MGASLVYAGALNCFGSHNCYSVGANNSENVHVVENWSDGSADKCALNANGLNIFVPTNTYNEWRHYYTNAPNVSFPLCPGIPDPGIICQDGFCQRIEPVAGARCNTIYTILKDPNADPSLVCGLQYNSDSHPNGINDPVTRGQEGSASFNAFNASFDFRLVCTVAESAKDSLKYGGFTTRSNGKKICPE